ncbi:MAG: N-acetylmuramoyl-L-alanine amidase, partial [Clostridia bacterium]|nr:N-acetylmuramoyl-L-alanine amidase [Clostridia bacterium]
IAEKDVNLDYALLLGEKLSSLGADVEYTRMDDDSVSLDKRYEMAVSSGRIFISLHCDSLPHSSTVDNPIGISLHANSRHSADLASFIGPYFESNNITVNYVDDKSNLYMTKPRNTYSLLIENQFVSSPDSFELLTNDEYMNNFTDLLCTALCNFFAG